jgi:flagellar biosynthetic protein FliQ
MEAMMEHTGKGFVIMLIISMPAVLTAALIGLIVGILQAVTQVQEQTIAAAPKILGVFLVLILMGPFSIKTLMEHMMDSTNLAFNIIPKSEKMILPSNGGFSGKFNFDDEKYFGEEKPSIKDAMKNPGKVPFVDNKFKESFTKTQRSPMVNPNLIEKKKIYTEGKKK